MKPVGFAMLVGGWALAVGGLLVSDATAMRLVVGVLGLGVSLTGIWTVNLTHQEHAIWKTKGR